jgi:hypothetical protein
VKPIFFSVEQGPPSSTYRLPLNASCRHGPSEARFREAGKRPALILSLRSQSRRVGMRVDDTCSAH